MQYVLKLLLLFLNEESEKTPKQNLMSAVNQSFDMLFMMVLNSIHLKKGYIFIALNPGLIFSDFLCLTVMNLT